MRTGIDSATIHRIGDVREWNSWIDKWTKPELLRIGSGLSEFPPIDPPLPLPNSDLQMCHAKDEIQMG
jgi:hypothetical protein